MTDIETKALDSIARMAYGTGFREGERGGYGNMGVMYQQDGSMRVIKYNTHRHGDQDVTTHAAEMKASANNLRAQLLTLARQAKVSDKTMASIRRQLGLSADDCGTTADALLTRRSVAAAVKLIDGKVWTRALKDADGKKIDAKALKSRTIADGDMSFAAVTADNAEGIKTESATDIALKHQIDAFANAEAAAIEKSGIFKGLPKPAQMLFEGLLKDAIGNRMLYPRNGQGEIAFRNMARITFLRLLVAYGHVGDAAKYFKSLPEDARGGRTWEESGFAHMARLISNHVADVGQANRDLPVDTPITYAKRLVTLLTNDANKFQRLSEDACCEKTDVNVMSNMVDDALKSARMPDHLQPGWAAIRTGEKNGRITPQQRTLLMENLLRKSSEDEVKIFSERIYRFNATPATPGERRRMEAVFEKAGLPKDQADDFLKKLDGVRVSQMDIGNGPVTMDQAVAFFEQHPEIVTRLDLRLNLAGNRQEIVNDFLKSLNAEYDDVVVNKEKSDPQVTGSGANVFMPSVREYNEGNLSVNGEPIPLEPSPEYKEVSGSVSGVETEARQAFIEALKKNIPNERQRLMVSYLMSMANGVEGYFQNRCQKVKELGPNPCNKALSLDDSMTLSDGKFSVWVSNSPRHFDLSFDKETDAVILDISIGHRQRFMTFNGTGVNGEPLFAEAMYKIKLCISAPKGNAEPTIELLALENAE